MTASTAMVSASPTTTGLSPALAATVLLTGSKRATQAARLVMARCTTTTATINPATRRRGVQAKSDKRPRTTSPSQAAAPVLVIEVASERDDPTVRIKPQD